MILRDLKPTANQNWPQLGKKSHSGCDSYWIRIDVKNAMQYQANSSCIPLKAIQARSWVINTPISVVY